MRLLLDADQKRFRAEVRTFLADALTQDVFDEVEVLRSEHSARFYTRLIEGGWMGMHWPREVGGRGLSDVEATIFLEECAAAEAPIALYLLTSLVGSAIALYGTLEQQQQYLGAAVEGEASFCLGYSEPEAGSDLASLRTRATRVGDEYVVNGQKMFTSLANCATHVFLAVRTGPEEPKHAGISLLIVPLSTPGIEITPVWTMGGFRTNMVFYDEVVVPVEQRVGEENRGWSVLTGALDLERTGANRTGLIGRLLRDIACEANDVWRESNDSAFLIRYGELVAQWAGARLLAYRAAWQQGAGDLSGVEASLAKLFSTELAQDVASFALDTFGEDAVIRCPQPRRFEHEYRNSFRYSVTGGASEIQRNIIALRGLGLPREGGR